MPSAAKTIHKSQGQTLDEIVVEMINKKRPHSHYVAFSRVRSLDGLYILALYEDKLCVDRQVVAEMNRLRNTDKMELSYIPMYSVSDIKLKVVFQNARSLHLHYKDLETDHNLLTSDIIAVAETRFKATESNELYALSGYEIYRNDQTHHGIVRPPHGIATYIKQSHNVHKSMHYSDESLEVSFLIIQLENNSAPFQLVVLYRSPKSLHSEFHHKFETFCSELNIGTNLPAIIVGDFNIDAFDEKHNCQINKMENVSKCKQHIKEFTTDYRTCLDLLFTNFSNVDTWTLSSTWSDHHTVFAAVDNNKSN